MEPESAEDARHDAGVHEDVADEMLVNLGKVLRDDELHTVESRAQVRAQVATAEAALAVGFRVAQLAATAERIAVALERIAATPGEGVAAMADALAGLAQQRSGAEVNT